MDATTILGRRVNEGEWNCMDHTGPGMPSWSMGKHPACGRVPKRVRDWAGPRPAKWAQCGVKNPQNELCKHRHQASHMPPEQASGQGRWRSSPGPAKKAHAAPGIPHALWAGHWIGAGWEQPRAREKGPAGA
ncbi:hypothetical protein B0H14DRAFT_2647261 [Mycena olivaceomarginata]|nr:hypothetical protein B0H14DRAFT_2647261 [Mycena olivaceomarginata]